MLGITPGYFNINRITLLYLIFTHIFINIEILHFTINFDGDNHLRWTSQSCQMFLGYPRNNFISQDNYRLCQCNTHILAYNYYFLVALLYFMLCQLVFHILPDGRHFSAPCASTCVLSDDYHFGFWATNCSLRIRHPCFYVSELSLRQPVF